MFNCVLRKCLALKCKKSRLSDLAIIHETHHKCDILNPDIYLIFPTICLDFCVKDKHNC